MSRLRKSPKLQTREARTKLKTAKEPYWHQIHPGLSLGYYKGARGGRWFAREYDHDQGRYHRRPLGTADDYADAEGRTVLDFAQAQRAAMGGVEPRKVSGFTVNDAADAYMRDFQGRSVAETQRVVDQEIKPKLGQRPVEKLTADEIKTWQRGLLEPNNKKDAARRDADPQEWTRRRKATANRVLTVLKAALNRAYEHDHVTRKAAWDRVKPYARVD